MKTHLTTMKTHTAAARISIRHFAAAAFLGCTLATTPVHAQIFTGFEPGAGYTDGNSVTGVDDTGIAGSATWSTSPTSNSAFSSSANPYAGTLSMRVLRTGTTSGASGASLNLASAGVDFSSTAWNFTISMAVGSGYSSGTGNQAQIYLGNNTFGSKQWLTLMFSEGHFYLYGDNGSGTGTQAYTSIAQYTTYADLGNYVTLSITVDPVAKTYLGGSIAGHKGSADFTSAIAGRALPWLSNTAGNPGSTFWVASGGNDIITVDYDNLTITNVPEPSVPLLLTTGLGAVALLRRRARLNPIK